MCKRTVESDTFKWEILKSSSDQLDKKNYDMFEISIDEIERISENYIYTFNINEIWKYNSIKYSNYIK